MMESRRLPLKRLETHREYIDNLNLNEFETARSQPAKCR